MDSTSDPNDLTGRFLNAVEEAKKALENQYGRKFSGLKTAIIHADEKKHSVVRNYRDILDTLVDLRNAIQHGNYNAGKPIAVPREDTVEFMEKLARWIERAPHISDYMIRNVDVLTPTATLSEAANSVIKHDISQMPVYDGRKYIGLFTTNAMARWLSTIIDSDGTLLADGVTVATILDHAEATEREKFFKPTAPVYTVCNALSSGDGPVAALITTDGKETGELQGLVTRYDVSRILKATTLSLK
ncbi:CBS domain-containing protein [Schaalia sp. ZJ405]|uniref:CBS domain-containing protein n=1 Tax=Schaalia sp. ZJ405 TaxID=2709403 RepID=UPI0013EB1410|nr:CBS domain-containing protein [Schaalia sp. ZJ405]QPK81360.1 CBS domain-containing protein [Schaalia sp. ZJ405]